MLSLLVLATCDGPTRPPAPTSGAVFRVSVCRGSSHAPEGEIFRIRLQEPETIAAAERLVGVTGGPWVAGRLARGSGGFNAPWSWHLLPETVEFIEGAVEACDGCPSFIEADLDHWVDRLGHYCPVETLILDRER